MNMIHQLSKINWALEKVKDSEIRERLMLLKQYYRSKSLRKTAQEYGCSHGKIQYWKDRYEAEGLRGLSTQEKSGRPSDVDPRALERIRQTVEKKSLKENWQVAHVRDYIKKKSGKQYTIRHTTRIIQSWGLSMITPRPQYMHAASKREQHAFLKEKHSPMEEMAEKWLAYYRAGREHIHL